ncbi:MAG: lamin tail domain-containing protein, partial [Verrucomicrobiales bacterium]|nr:lamin tail domain-containing protein [Verrucomicrobiales bacterium]
MRKLFVFWALIGAVSPVFSAPVISEFMASNGTTLLDFEGDSADWIEIYNPDGEVVDLGGYYLTDDADELTRWEFPPTTLGAGGYLVVFASGKDRTDVTGEEKLHTNFSLNAGGGYLALVAPDGVTVIADFGERYPDQFEDVAYGKGLAGTVSTVQLAPTWVGLSNYANVALQGADSTGLNGLDVGTGAPNTQRYLWLDFSEKLASIPTGQRVVSAELSWGGEAQTVFDAVASKVGVFPVPDGERGKTTLEASGASALVDYYAANAPLAEEATVPGQDDEYRFDLVGAVTAWLADPEGDQWGELMLLNERRPYFVKYAPGTTNPDLSFVVQTTNATSADPVSAYLDSPTPGEANSGGSEPGPLFRKVTEDPEQPVAGDLTITAKVQPLARPVESVKMFFRQMFGEEVEAAMVDDGSGGDEVAGDTIYTAVIPANVVVPGDMVRWRFEARDDAGLTTKEPAFRDPNDSHEYYGTVGADDTIQSNLTVLHWFTQRPRRADSATGTKGSVYYLGEFYDNVHFDLHGQSTSGFPKKSYNVDFTKTQRFRWDATGEAPRVKDINLLTNWADKSKVRHVLAYELFREAGVAAHFAYTVRVEQNGEFFSVADFVEDGDERYLERAGLNKDGVLYKAYSNTLTSTSGMQKKTRKFERRNTDLQSLVAGLAISNRAARAAFMYDNIDIPACVNMMAANALVRNWDMFSKNWYLYRDTGKTDEWAILPWDLDLSLGRRWTGGGVAYFDNVIETNDRVQTANSIRLVSHMWADPDMSEMLRRRIRTLHDEYLNVPGTPLEERYMERRLDEQLALVAPAGIVPSDAERDLIKWGSWLHGGQKVVFGSARWEHEQVETMAEAIGRFKDEFLVGRREEIFTRYTTSVSRNLRLPATPQPADPSPAMTFTGLEFNPASGNQDEEYIELTNPNSFSVDLSGWALSSGVEFVFPGGLVLPAGKSLYVTPDKVAFRARGESPMGGERHLIVGPYKGHLSSLGETVVLLDQNGAEVSQTTYVGDPSDVQRFLRVTEIMYHPAGSGDGEFIELANISDAVTLDLEGVKVVDGVEFDFSGSAVTSLAPGGRVLVVRSVEAFEAIYGAGLSGRVAGAFANDSKLSNGGERLDIEDAGGGTVVKFAYNDNEEWPAAADGEGASLVLINPGS